MNAPHAILFAADRATRVKSLMLWHPELGAALSEEFSILNQLASVNEQLHGRTAVFWGGWERPESIRAMMRMRAASTSPERRLRYYETFDERFDAARRALPTLEIPVLEITRPDSELMAAGQGQAARLARSGRHVTVSGWQASYALGDSDEVFRALEQFASERGDVRSSDETTHGIQIVLFTDIESSTATTQQLGDERAQQMIRGHNTAVREALAQFGGRERKHTGDGIMASFTSAEAAVNSAIQIQVALSEGTVRVRVGVNAGEPIAEKDDLFGTAVQLASRITDRAEPGQVLVSNVVRELCAGKDFLFDSVGSATLKGFSAPVELFEARIP